MTITEDDIKLLESERMRDTSDGGGVMTGSEIPDGVAGNVFPKVSRDDSVNGRVNLRKIYGAVLSANQDTYAGAHFAIMDPPDNAKVGVCCFSTGSSFDERSAARDRIESYVIAGPASRMILYGRQLEGQSAVRVWQRPEEPLPDVGEVLALSIEDDAYPEHVQFLAITDIDHEVRTFTHQNVGQYERRVITLQIGSRLAREFPGATMTPYADAASPTVVRQTTVADAARYYGIQPLAQSAIAGALSVVAESAYHQLVPTATREVPVSLAEISGARVSLVAGIDVRHPDSGDVSLSDGESYFLGHYATRVVGEWEGSSVLDTEDQFDLLPGQSKEGEHDGGTLTFTGDSLRADGNVWRLWLTATPGAEITQSAHTRNIEITLATRGTVYTETLLPIPAPGTLQLSYRALGRWYTLRDDGTGAVTGGAGEGTGTVDYTTGGLVVTLGALPDVGSSILLSWGSPVHYTRRDDAAEGGPYAVPEPRLRVMLANVPVVASSVAVSWTDGPTDTAMSASDDGSGAITGDATGSVDYIDGDLVVEFTTLPKQGTSVSISYDQLVDDGDGTAVIRTGTVVAASTMSLGTSITADSLRMVLVHDVTAAGWSGGASGQVRLTARDEGGQLVIPAQTARTDDEQLAVSVVSDQVVGLVDYQAGEVEVTADTSVEFRWYNPTPGSAAWLTTEEAASLATGSDAEVAWKAQGETGTAQAQSLTYDPATDGLELDLTPGLTEATVPGSALFSLAGKTYIDRAGTLYADVDPETGSGTEAGSYDYDAGIATLTWWGATADALTVDALLTRYGDWTAIDTQFRTAGSPLRAASTYVQVNTVDGRLLTATCDQSGVLQASEIEGTVKQDMGVVTARFGQYVVDADLSSEEKQQPWYDIDDVREDGTIWRPTEVLPETLRYSTVVQTRLPLDASLLGLDPVRLPQDGRVPIYRAGDMVILHDTQRTQLADPVSAGHVVTLPRDDLAACHVEDADGDRIPDDQYTVDLAAGTIEFSAQLDLTGYTEPLDAVHRVEDMVLCTDAQIDGTLSLSSATTHDYAAGQSYASTALRYGDLAALVTNVFDMQTWTSEWADDATASGSQGTLAEYNDIDYPIEVLNESAVTERWAIRFTSSTEFELISENMGVLATGDTATDFGPVNPRTGLPYFVIRAAGWGGGWSAGYVLRFDTVGANAPIWLARTILSGASRSGDSFAAEFRGDTD